MTNSSNTAQIAMQVARDMVVASIQVDLTEGVLGRFKEDLLHRLHKSGSRGVILDVSGLETLDAAEFESLRRIITMIRVMGAETVLAGLRPGVVSALIETGVDTEGLRTAIDLDAAFGLLLQDTEPEVEAVDEEADGEEPAESGANDSEGTGVRT
ncbi:MAG: STAS domain-containing protein [Gammaproteobacteria bacterium]|jgi:rsbT antagonist protein RsbS